MKWSAHSSKGLVRSDNEDAWAFERLERQDAYFAVVADGIGGNEGGEIASQMAVGSCVEYIRSHFGEDDTLSLLDRSMRNANDLIYRAGSDSDGFPGMGTTFTGALVAEKDGKAFIGHVGDSRAYLLSKGQIRQITDDHSVTGELLRDGAITEEDAMRHPSRNMLTMALGTQHQVDASTYVEELAQGDVLILCTDGLTSLVGSSEIASLAESLPRDRVAESLVELANSRGGYDNITVVLLWPDLS